MRLIKKMAIKYEIIFNNPDFEELEKYLRKMPYFESLDVEKSTYIFRKGNKNYPDSIIGLHDLGLDITDYLSGVGREQIGLLVEYLTGIYDEIVIKEKD
jgi:hypothetical protein